MKKPLKLSIIIVSSVLAAVLITVLTLSFINVNPLKRLPENYSVYVYEQADVRKPYNDATVAKVKEGINDSSFSVMHALLEYRYSYSFKFLEDSDDERVKLYGKDNIEGYLKPGDGKYMLEFVYTTPQSVKVGKETVTFDHVRMLVSDMSGEIERVEMVFYEYAKLYGEPADEYYSVTPVYTWMATSKLYTALKSLDALFVK